MEWLHSFWAKISQAIFWQNVINHIHWLDWITAAFVIFGVMYGVKKGFFREVVEILEMIIIIFLTHLYYPILLSFLTSYIPKMTPHSLAPAAFILTGLAAWFVVSFFDRPLQKWVHSKLPNFLRISGGVVGGIFHFLILWSFISQAILLMPIKTFPRLYESGHSVTGPFTKELVPAIYKRASESVMVLAGK